MNQAESKDLGGSILFIAILFIMFGTDEWIIPFIAAFLLLCFCAIPTK